MRIREPPCTQEIACSKAHLGLVPVRLRDLAPINCKRRDRTLRPSQLGRARRSPRDCPRPHHQGDSTAKSSRSRQRINRQGTHRLPCSRGISHMLQFPGIPGRSAGLRPLRQPRTTGHPANRRTNRPRRAPQRGLCGFRPARRRNTEWANRGLLLETLRPGFGQGASAQSPPGRGHRLGHLNLLGAPNLLSQPKSPPVSNRNQ